MLRDYLLLLVDLWGNNVWVDWWGGTTSSWNVASRVSAGPTCASVFGIVYELVRLVWFLSWCVVKAAVAAVLGGYSSALMLWTVDWLLLIVITILACEILPHMRAAAHSLSRIRNVWRCLNGSFSLGGRGQNRVARRISHAGGNHFWWISGWISYCIMTWGSLSRHLVCHHGMLWSGLLASLHRSYILGGLWVPQAVVSCLVDLRNASINILISKIGWGMLAARWADIGRLLSLISTAKWISIRLRLFSRRSYRRHTVTLWNIFTISGIPGVSYGI